MKSHKAAFGAVLASLGLVAHWSGEPVAMAAPAKQEAKAVHFEKSAQIAAFWKWFAQHQPQLSAMTGPQVPMFTELTRQFKAIDKDLVFEIAPIADGKKEFDVSANCNPALFSLVESTVAAAPAQIKDWKINAFRRKVPPAVLKDLSIAAQPALNGKIIAGAAPVGVAVKDMRFKLIPDGSKAKVTIFIKNYKADGPQSHMAELMVQQALGEYDAVKKISGIKCESGTAVAAKDAIPFQDLAAAVDKIVKK